MNRLSTLTLTLLSGERYLKIFTLLLCCADDTEFSSYALFDLIFPIKVSQLYIIVLNTYSSNTSCCCFCFYTCYQNKFICIYRLPIDQKNCDWSFNMPWSACSTRLLGWYNGLSFATPFSIALGVIDSNPVWDNIMYDIQIVILQSFNLWS